MKIKCDMASINRQYGLKTKQPPGPVRTPRADLNLKNERLNRYFFSTGIFGQPEVDSVNSLAEKHQMTNFLPLIQLASLAALR